MHYIFIVIHRPISKNTSLKMSLKNFFLTYTQLHVQMTGKITPTRLTQTRARSQTYRSFYIARNAGRVLHIQLMRGKYSSIKEHLSMQPRSHGAAGAGAAKTSGRGENAAWSGGGADCARLPRAY